MARARNIKPGFFKNEDLAECTPWTRLLFPGLWMLADREGRLENRPKRIKGEIFPFDNVDVQPLLDELESWKFIKRYEVCGVKCIQIVNFIEHQSPHGTEKDSDLPCENGFLTVNERNKGTFVTGKTTAVPYGEPLNNGIQGGFSPPNNGIQGGFSPPNNGATTVNPPLDTGATTVNPPLDNALNPDSLIPESLLLAAKQPQPNSEKQRAARLPKDWLLPKSWGQWTIDELGWDELSVRREAEKFRDFWIAKGGRDAAKLDWEATWRNWCRNAKVSTAGSGASLLVGGI
jgi:hypothetical protein